MMVLFGYYVRLFRSLLSAFSAVSTVALPLQGLLLPLPLGNPLVPNGKILFLHFSPVSQCPSRLSFCSIQLPAFSVRRFWFVIFQVCFALPLPLVQCLSALLFYFAQPGNDHLACLLAPYSLSFSGCSCPAFCTSAPAFSPVANLVFFFGHIF